MTAPVDATVVHISEKLAERGVAADARAAVRATPAGAADASVGTIHLGRETADGVPVERLPDAAVRAPRWRRAGRGAASVARLTALGVAVPIRTVWEYETAGEVSDQIRVAKAERATCTDPERRRELDAEIERLRQHRHEVAHARHREHATLAGLGAAGTVTAALVVATVMLGLVVPAGALAVGAGGAYLAGRRADAVRAQAAAGARETAAVGPDGPQLGGGTVGDEPVPADGVYTPAALAEGGAFPIARAQTEAEAAECMLRALLAEGVPVGDVSEVTRTGWGWQAIVRVTSGTPGAIIRVTDNLETLFDTAHGSVRPQPLVERRACAKLRIIESDPFASAPAPEYLPPKSISIRDRRRIGSSIDGEELLATLAGVMGEVVAASGGGKTGILQALAEVTTACRDAITIDLDPAGDGLEDLGPAARLQGRTHEQIEHTLLWLLMLAKARARLRKSLGMGRKWVASPEHPSIVVFIDEYPKLSKLAKRLAWDLLLVGRKEAVPVVFASQGGTSAYLGENIAQMLALKIVGPCKKVDTSAVFGDGAAAEGWLPHRLAPATDTDPRDAGHVYAQGVPGTTDAPIEYKIHEHPKGALAKLAEERRDAGLLDPDVESLRAMAGVDLPDYVLPEYDAEGNEKKPAPVELLTWRQLLRLCEADPPAASVTPETDGQRAVRHVLEVMAALGMDRFRVETMAAHLRERFPDGFGALTADDLGRLLRDAGCGNTVPIGAVDGRRNASGYRREALEAVL